MSRRTLASVVVGCLVLVLGCSALLLPVPYVTMSPGPTVNVLGSRNGAEIIDVSGHRTYPTSGDLRLTTVSVTNPTSHVGLGQALAAWFDKTQAVYPRDVIYPPDQTAADSEQESSVEMVGSQDTAVAAALTQLGYKLKLQVEVLAVTKGAPADGKLEVRDRILRVGGQRISDADQVTKAVQASGAGRPLTIVVGRGSATKSVVVTPKASADGKSRAVVGVQIGTGYDFPFDVTVRLGDDIGGPSAGLMFSLGVYDTLTPGSLTGGTDIAGTGTIDEDGHVGPIGGIQQKIVAADRAGAKIFFVPPGNCDEALAVAHGGRKDDMKLVKATTMHSAVESLTAYDADHDARLPACR